MNPTSGIATLTRINLRYVNGFANRGRKSGRLRYYFRRRGSKTIPLPGVPGSDEFMETYAAALAGLPETIIEPGASRTMPGSIDGLVAVYYKSDAWSRLAPETKKTRCRIIERFRVRHGDKRVTTLRQEHVEKMLGEVESYPPNATGSKPFAACSQPRCRACAGIIRPPGFQ